MIKLTSIFLLFTSLIFSNFVEAAQVRAQCTRASAADPVLYGNDFKWDYDMKGMLAKNEEVYASPKRLFNRAYFDTALKSYVMEVYTTVGTKKIRIPPSFIKNVRKHVELSLQRHYADVVNITDFGHSHLFIPLPIMKELDKIDYDKDRNIFYEKAFAISDIKLIYHTAERLTLTEGERRHGPLIQDKYLMWRYHSRNVLAQNDGSDSVSVLYEFGEGYNTVKDLEGYFYMGAGFNISSNQNGCFEFTKDGKTFYFDLSMDDLPPDPNQGGGYTDG